MKILYTNGCSMTNYESLSENLQWPYLVRQSLKIPTLINDAEGCGSNQRIFRTTYDFVTSKKFNSSECLVLIQMTYPFRFEYLQTNRTWAAVNQHSYIAEDQQHADSYRKIRLRYYSEEEEKYEFIQKLYAIDNLLKKVSVKNYFFLNYLLPIDEKDTIKKLDNDFSWVVDRSSVKSQMTDYESIDESDPHPNANGHRKIADWIVRNISHRIL